jgi:hypothetical protein
MMKWAERVARVEKMRNLYNILVGKHGGRGPLGRPGSRRNDNITLNLREMGLGYGLGSSGSGLLGTL